MYKVLVAHPGKQHSFELATALKERGILYKYVTCIYDRPGSLTNLVMGLLKGNNYKKAKSRCCPALDEKDVIQFDELRALLLLFISKFPNSVKLWRYFNGKLSDSFGKKVAKWAIKENVDAVICYDTNCNVLFDVLKKKAPHILRIMDVSTANRAFMRAEFDLEIERTMETALKDEQEYLWNSHNEERFVQEIVDTQHFIVASNFVRRSLLFSGVDVKKISVVPYGVDIDKFDFTKRDIPKKVLKLIYVGQISYKKGLSHLLKVMESFPQDTVELAIVGAYDATHPLYQKYKDVKNVNFKDFVTRDILAEIYRESDVFVFPTLGEGFGMVVLEAMSCGLPCIISDHAGGNDVIISGENGFEFEAGNDSQLENHIQWFLDNRELLPQMSEKARQTAEVYTWKKYHETVSDVVCSLLDTL